MKFNFIRALPMRILYYLEPLIEQQNPSFRVGALKNTILRQAEQLTKGGHHVSVLTSSHTYQQCLEQGVSFTDIDVIQVSMQDSLRYFRDAEHSAEINYLCHDEETHALYQPLYKEALGKYAPDLIISWESPNNVLKSIFPEVPALHMMPGFFSRVPFPELSFIDPCGFFKDSTLYWLQNDIKHYEPSEGEKSLVDQIKTTYFNGYLANYSPFKREELDPENKFDKLVLLPLQVSGYFAFDFHTDYKNQMDFLVGVLSKIPKNVGVVVTQYVTHHTKDTPINAKTIQFLESEFPNLIYKPVFDKLDGVSQYLLPHVDAVISTSSSIAFQAAFLQKPVYMVGESHISIISRPFRAIDDTNAFDPVDQDNVLAFILTRLMPLTVSKMYDGDWFCKFVENYNVTYGDFDSAQKHESGQEIIFNNLVNNPIYDDIDQYTYDFINAGKPHVAVRKLNDTGDDKVKRFIQNKDKTFKLISDPSKTVVSFDIFDTLVVRPFAKPVDLFRYMDDRVSLITSGIINDFHVQRPKAEQILKKRLRERNAALLEDGVDEFDLTYEIQLDEIYEILGDITHLEDEEALNCVKQLEVSTELDLLYPRKSGVELFRAAKSLGKKVVITSDMYLPLGAIEMILKKNGITDFDKLYLSSEIGYKKHEGHLFQHVLDDLAVPANQIIHVGDNEHGDIASAKKYGISTIHTPRSLEMFYKNKPSREIFFKNRNKASLSEAISVGIAANRLYDDPNQGYWGDTLYHGSEFNLGYLGLGWMFFSYAKWILESAISDGMTDLYFLARDGEIIKKVYDVIAPHYENAPKSHYLLASRRSARVASIKNKNDLSIVARSAFYNGSIETYFESKLGYDASKISHELLIEHGFGTHGLKSKANTNELKENLYNLTMALSDEIIASAKVEGDLLEKYFVDQGLKNANTRVAVVDIGYAGTMQDSMIRMLNRDVGGYYLMTFESALKLKKQRQVIKAFAGDFVNPDHSSHPICSLGLAFEVIFSNSDGSFIKMTPNGMNYTPVFESTLGEEVKLRFIPKMQMGIVCFAQDVMGKFGSSISDIYFDNHACFATWKHTLTKPSGRDAALFEGVTFDDNFAGAGYRYMVPPRELGPYTENLKKQTVWPKGSEVFLRIPSVVDTWNKDKGKSGQNKDAAESVVKVSEAPNALVTKVFGVIIRDKKKLRKFHRDPESFFADSKNPVFNWAGKVYMKLAS